MKIHEINLKHIIKSIEMYGSIKEIKIENSSIIIELPDTKSKQPCPSKVMEIDLNKPKKFTISFFMGDEKKDI